MMIAHVDELSDGGKRKTGPSCLIGAHHCMRRNNSCRTLPAPSRRMAVQQQTHACFRLGAVGLFEGRQRC